MADGLGWWTGGLVMRCEDCIKQDYFVLCLWSVAIADVVRTGHRQKLVFLFAEKEMQTHF